MVTISKDFLTWLSYRTIQLLSRKKISPIQFLGNIVIHSNAYNYSGLQLKKRVWFPGVIYFCIVVVMLLLLFFVYALVYT